MKKSTLFLYFVLALALICYSSCKDRSHYPTPPLIGFTIDHCDQEESVSRLTSIKLDSTQENHRILYQALADYPFMQWSVEYSHKVNLHIASASSSSLQLEGNLIKIELENEQDLYRAASLLCQLSSLSDKQIPSCRFELHTRFDYRGMHLDVGRHMFEVVDIKRYLDYLFFYGYNRFHWHLTEDQGWRIEIKQYPKLQEIAAYRDETLIGHYNDEPQEFDGKRYGGYYTQEQVREIVEYASNLGIEVIPEIELPGHCQAALTAYPELSCDPTKDYTVAKKWGIFDDIYCPTEKTFRFLENVFDEIIPLFPSKYIHIGGDEVPKRAWKESAFCQKLMAEKGFEDEEELQSYFIGRVADYLEDHGKTIIGWDEILDGPLPQNAVVMSWRGKSGGLQAAQTGHNVIMTPSTHCYFDYYQSTRQDEPLAIGGFIPLRKVYAYDPIPEELDTQFHHHIMGAQGNVWTEYMSNFDQVEYMALARMAALSEVFVLTGEERDYSQFAQKLSEHINFWSNQGVNIANHLSEINPSLRTVNGQGSNIEDFNASLPVTIEYRKSDSEQWETIRQLPFPLSSHGTYYFRSMNSTGQIADSLRILYEPHLGTSAEIKMTKAPHAKYSGFGPTTIVNGIKAPQDKYGGNEWLGFAGQDLELLVSFADAKTVNKINLQVFNAPGQWIYLPQSILVEGSQDGTNFEKIGELLEVDGTTGANEYQLAVETGAYQSLKVKAQNFGEIPEGKQGAGHEAWLFIGEIMIK